VGHEDQADASRSGLSKPFQAANAAGHSAGWWRCWSTYNAMGRA
jgi:hypothetical protein